MSILEWLSLAGVCALGAMSPGPSLLIVLRHASASLVNGAACALAHGLAIGLYALLSALGLTLLLTQSPVLFTGLQWIGALFLLYLGWKALSAPSPNSSEAAPPISDTTDQPQQAQPASPVRAAMHAVMQGFAIAFFNPKVALFFTALFSQFLSDGQGTSTKIAMATLAGGIDGAWYLLIATLVYIGRKRGIRGGSWSHRLQQLFGILLIGLAARLVWTLG
ncbi:LysE family translocator [Microbulbifer sp. CAU 1566]|uniref:LysE family translocator n=1 Tax=Microbulbifer sp. CAU 1566 TaxID=2933269 RepID=UPI002005EEF7|nr:LysE family translocator [Microbulbifer sp. CAU 1566]MCK7597046.1 LysE family translocator [Microbulbifer sp. CAU 1566]